VYYTFRGHCTLNFKHCTKFVSNIMQNPFQRPELYTKRCHCTPNNFRVLKPHCIQFSPVLVPAGTSGSRWFSDKMPYLQCHQVTPEFPINLRKIQQGYDTNLLQVIICHRISTYGGKLVKYDRILSKSDCRHISYHNCLWEILGRTLKQNAQNLLLFVDLLYYSQCMIQNLLWNKSFW
jgi:hypothetical protein